MIIENISISLKLLIIYSYSLKLRTELYRHSIIGWWCFNIQNVSCFIQSSLGSVFKVRNSN